MTAGGDGVLFDEVGLLGSELRGIAPGAGIGWGVGGAGAVSKYLSLKSETISRLSDNLATIWKEASAGISRMTSPDSVLNPYWPPRARDPGG